MASGIYQLKFSNGMRYIGKSIDLERRWKEHWYNFDNHKAASKMQAEFMRCGYPETEVLLYCHRDHLDIMETYLIATFRPELNTVTEMPISHDDFNALMQQSQLLEESTVEHIKLISDLANRIDTLEEYSNDQDRYIEELEKDIDLEKLSVESYARLVEEREAHIETRRELELTVENLAKQLAKETNKSWLAKLFGR